MNKNKLYECQVAFTYEATDPVDAARQLIANIQMNPNWFVTVTDTDNPEHKFSVDTETGECESSENSNEQLDFDFTIYEIWGYVFHANRIFDTDLGSGWNIFNKQGEFVLEFYVESYEETDEEDVDIICDYLRENYF
jgi:hypothetical protein